MAVCSNSARSFWFIFGLTTALAWAAPQTANIPPAIIPGGYRIAGSVVSKADGRPLGRARVTVRDAKEPQKFQSMVTAEDGKYEFNGVPAGKYSLTGAKRGFIAASYDQHDQYSTAIVTGAGLEAETLVLRLAPNAVIAGKVLDQADAAAFRRVVQISRDACLRISVRQKVCRKIGCRTVQIDVLDAAGDLGLGRFRKF